MLKPIIKDDNRDLWCAPAAFAEVSGHPTSIIHEITDNYKVDPGKDIDICWLDRILKLFGFEPKFIYENRPLSKIMRSKGLQLPIIENFNELHIITAYDGFFVDNNNLNPVKFKDDYKHICWYNVKLY